MDIASIRSTISECYILKPCFWHFCHMFCHIFCHMTFLEAKGDCIQESVVQCYQVKLASFVCNGKIHMPDN